MQHGGHVECELDGIQEGPVDGRLVGHGDLPHHVNDTAQCRIVLEHHVQAGDRRGQGIDHITEGLDRLGHLLGNRHQEIHHRGLQIQADVVDRDVGFGRHTLAQTPIPVELEVGIQTGHARDPQGHGQVQVRTHAKVDLDR